MKVLHVYRTYFPDPPGGLQEAIRQICLAMQPFDVASTIFTLSPNPHPRELALAEARLVRCRSWAAPASCDLGGPDALRQFARLAREADVIHYLFPWPFGDLLHQVIRPRKPAVLTYISDIVRQQWLAAPYRPLMRKTLREMDAIVANSPAYGQTSPVLSHRDVRERVRIIPLGIDETSYPPPEGGVVERLGIGSDVPFFLFIGVLRYYKGLRGLILAALAVDAPVVIAGVGPEEAVLRRMARELGARNVVFAGRISDGEKVALLKACRALLLPSHLRSEAFGMVLVEAAMFGRPMVSCEIGTGTSFVNADGETGLVVPPDDPGALADAMNRLLADDVLAFDMGTAARLRYERLFSPVSLGREYATLFREVVGQVELPKPTADAGT